MKINFFTIFFSVCRGTSMFPILTHMPIKRVLFHLLFLVMLLAGFVTFCKIFPAVKFKDRLITDIHKEFGNIDNTDHGFSPTVSPGQKRLLEIVPGYVMAYFPDNQFSSNELGTKKFNRGIIWNPGFAGMWIKQPNESFVIIPLIYTTKIFSRFSSDNLTPKDAGLMTSTVKEFYDTKGPFVFGSLAQMASTFLFSYLFSAYFMELLRGLFCVLIFNTLFTGCYSFGGGAAMAGLRYRNLWVIGVYASFPALLIASFFPAFDLPYFDYSTIYLFAFLGYFLFIFSKFQRMRAKTIDDDGDI